ncbi:hypothetical protein ACROYT_G004644 [Oculina patagonica]
MEAPDYYPEVDPFEDMDVDNLFDEPVMPQNEKQIVPKPPTYEESLKDLLEGNKEIYVDPQYFPEYEDELPPEYDEDEIDYALDADDEVSEILEDVGIDDYDVVQMKLDQPEMTPKKTKNYLNKILEKAKYKRRQLKGFKANVTKEYNRGTISEAERQIKNKRISNARVALNDYINHYESKAKTIKAKIPIFDTYNINLDRGNGSYLTTCRLEYGNGVFYPETEYDSESKVRIFNDLMSYGMRKNDYNSGTQLNLANYNSLYPIIFFDLSYQAERVTRDPKQLIFRYKLNANSAGDSPFNVHAIVLYDETIVIDKKKQTECIPESEQFVMAKNGRLMLKCKCVECGITKTKFVKSQSGGALARYKGPSTTDKIAYMASNFVTPAPSFGAMARLLAGQAFKGVKDNVDYYRKGKGIDIHKAILKVAPKKGFVIPGHKYTGPGNPLEKQVKWDPKTGKILKIYEQPTGKTDAVSMQHDVDYSVCADKPSKDQVKCKNEADKKMVKALDAIPWKDRQWGHAIARNTIATKAKIEASKKKNEGTVYFNLYGDMEPLSAKPKFKILKNNIMPIMELHNKLGIKFN